jgi:dimethylglycine catabolism B
MRVLPVLESRRDALEKCVFCPKLCRSACPVSNAEPRETITPWGKMSAAWQSAHGDVPMSSSHAAPAWACTGCFACRESCDHRNVVADVLLDARDALAQKGVAPPGARRAVARFPHHDARTRAAARALAAACEQPTQPMQPPTTRATRARVDARSASPVGRAGDALLVGCGYLRAAKREARDAVDAATALSGHAVALVEGCCGLPLLLAGDTRGFVEQARAVARSLANYDRVWVADAGCALSLKRRYPDAGVTLRPAVETLAEAAARRLESLTPIGGLHDRRDEPDEPVRWHDPCQLGRGLGVYDAPRLILTRALGRAPDELDDRRERAICSGAGGLLPSTMPGVARAIADERLHAHARAGGGRIVTACASSLIALRRRAIGSGVAVDDLVTWIARAARPELRSPSP